jgi:hypothetical protein
MDTKTNYELSPELKRRIRLYCALFGKTDNWNDGVINIYEVKYLCEPHPSFLDFIVERLIKLTLKPPNTSRLLKKYV